MLAGEVYIDIAARVTKMEAALKETERLAESSGKKSGGKFGLNFGDEFGKGAAGIARQFAGPMFAVGLAKAVSTVLRSDKSMPLAVLDALKTIPFVGAFADLGHAIYDSTFGAADKAAEDLGAQAEAARASVLTGRGMAEAAEREAQAARATLMIENRKLELAEQVLDVRARGSERGVAYAEYESRLGELNLQHQLDRAATEDEQTRKLLDQRHERQLTAIKAERDEKLKAIAEADAREAEAAQRQEQAEAERMAREQQAIDQRVTAADDLLRRAQIEMEFKEAMANADNAAAVEAEKERDKKLRALEKEQALRGALSDAERAAIEERFDLEERMASMTQKAIEQQQQTAQSASTALGTYTFDPYPATQQRAVQERTMRATELTAEKIAAAGVF